MRTLKHRFATFLRDEDGLIPPAFGPEWASRIPGAELRTYPEAGHLVLDESADAVADIAQFFT
mgnify:CR=1 FL=1